MLHRKKRNCTLGCKNPVAYCRLHRCTMSVTQMKNRKCLSKNCVHFRKIRAHHYWEQRELRKQRREIEHGR